MGAKFFLQCLTNSFTMRDELVYRSAPFLAATTQRANDGVQSTKEWIRTFVTEIKEPHDLWGEVKNGDSHS
jgi:hypothetical protein